MAAVDWDAIIRRGAWNARDLMSHAFPEPRWAVPGFLAEGLNVLAGAPKAGKSWLALGLAASVALGGKALSKVDVEAGDVLYLALEDTPGRLQRRLSMILGTDPVPGRLELRTAWPRFGEGCGEFLHRHLEEREYRLVVVDVFAKVRDPQERGSAYLNDYREANALKSIADQYGVAMLVLHHTRKLASEDYVDTVSGTNGLTGCADTVLVLKRSRTNADAVLSITGRDVAEADHALKFDSERGAWTLLGAASEHALTDQRKRVRDLIVEHGLKRPGSGDCSFS